MQEREARQNRPAPSGFWGKVGSSLGFQQKGHWSGEEIKEDVPPWELLHINNVGIDLETMAVPANFPTAQEEKPPQRVPLTWKIPRDDTARSDRIHTTSTLVDSERGLSSQDIDTRKHGSIEEESGEDIALPTLAKDPDSRSRHSLDPDGPPSPLQLDEKISTARHPIHHRMGSSTEERVGSNHEANAQGESGTEEPRDHALRDFFIANQAVEHNHTPTVGFDLRAEESAASYFNRQASLLMLYFPLAYLFIFTFSLVRLLYDMITSKANPGLTIVSLWFVLSAGLVDALVYVSTFNGRFSLQNIHDSAVTH